MIRALLAGSKTQTRRILKPQPEHRQHYEWNGQVRLDSEYRYWCYKGHVGHDNWANITDQLKPALPVHVGDRLWVREAHALVTATAYRMSEGVSTTINPSDEHQAAIYRCGFDRSNGGFSWRPSIHMPRWASRLTLVVTEVRVQHLQDIDQDDAIAEGCRGYVSADQQDGEMPTEEFQDLWITINGQNSWDANPWVAAYTFTVHKQNIDQMGETA